MLTGAATFGIRSMASDREPTLEAVAYLASGDSIMLVFTGGVRLELPRAWVSELVEAKASELQHLELGNAGTTISQRRLDIDIYVPGLLQDLFGPGFPKRLATAGMSALAPPTP